MTTKKIQTGWEFKGSNVHTKDYTKLHFFSDPKISINIRNNFYGEIPVERVEEVSATISNWRHKEGDTLPEQFEIVLVVRLNDKIIKTEILKATPYYEEIEIEEIEEGV